MPVTKITWQETYARLKQILAAKKGLQPSDIQARQSLAGDLKFTVQGRRALSVPINQSFADVGVVVTPAETQAAKFVRDLFELVWGKVPAQNKDES